MILAQTNRRIIRPSDKPSFEHTQRYGLIKGHPLGPAGGLVLFSIMNEGSGNKVFDLSGNGHGGTFQNTPIWTPGKYGTAIDFDSGDTINCGNNVDVTVPFTFVCSFKSDDVTQTYMLASTKKTTNAYNGANLYHNASKISLQYGDGVGTGSAARRTFVSDDTISTGEWVHVVGTVLSSTTCRISINGKSSTYTTSGSGDALANGDFPCIIGQFHDSNPLNYVGEISHLFIYDREFTDSEASLLYQKPFCMVQKRTVLLQVFVPTGVVKALTGTIDAQTAVTGDLSVTKKLTGTTATQVVVTGSLDVTKELTGTADSTSTVAGSIGIAMKLTVTVDGQSVVSGLINVSTQLTATVDVAATVTGSIAVTRELIGTVTVQSTVSGNLSGIISITGVITCISTIAGALTLPAGGLSAYAELKILDHIVGKATYSKPVVAIGLCTSDPGNDATGAACNEVANTNGYGRIAVPDTDWNAAAAGQIDNANPITFPEATGSWGEITDYVLLGSAVHGQGNVLVYDKLDQSKTIVDDEIVNFAAGQLNFVLA